MYVVSISHKLSARQVSLVVRWKNASQGKFVSEELVCAMRGSRGQILQRFVQEYRRVVGGPPRRGVR